MTSLFSRFDLALLSGAFWILSLVICLILSFACSKFSLFTIFFRELGAALRMFFLSLKKDFSKRRIVLFARIIFSIFIINFFSVFSFVFPFSSQFGLILGFSLVYWLRLLIFRGKWNFKGFISHLIPEGSPLGLSFFLFLIEVVSNFIRPVTLSIRLVANILAGHLLLTLLSNLVFILSPCVLLYFILNLVELGVAIIQAYIFCTIIVLYFSEV